MPGAGGLWVCHAEPLYWYCECVPPTVNDSHARTNGQWTVEIVRKVTQTGYLWTYDGYSSM